MTSTPSAGPLRARLQSRLTTALKARDTTAVAATRSALSAISNAEAVDASHPSTSSGGVIAGAVSGLGTGEVPRRELSEKEVATIVAAEVGDRRTSALEYRRLGRTAEAARLRAEASVLEGLLSVDDAPPEPGDTATTAAGEGVPDQ